MDEVMNHRLANFAVCVEPAPHQMFAGEMEFRYTHNGTQWFNLCLSPREAEIVIQKLQEYLVQTYDNV
jgi:hypothetical protein